MVLGQSVVVVAVATRVLHNLTDMTRDIQGDRLLVVVSKGCRWIHKKSIFKI